LGKIVAVTTTIRIVCRVPEHDHEARMVSRWDDGRNGEWRPRPAFKRQLSDDKALIWSPSDRDPRGEVHLRYKFPCGAEATQARLHALLDDARALGRSEINLG